MEIPDVLAVTKADRDGADTMMADLRTALSLVPSGPWEPPIVPVRALEDGGVDDLWGKVEAHRAFLDAEGRLEERRRDGLARQLRALAAERIARRVDAGADDDYLAGLIGEVIDRRLDPSSAVDRVLERAGLG
jgi:LAO/AO transport system kinase